MVNIIELLKELCRKIKKINDEKFDVASLQNICNNRSLTIGSILDLGSNITNSASVVLVGNMLRINFTSSGSHVDAGNITNEVMISFTTQTQMLFNDSYGGRINNGTTGGIASFYLASIQYYPEFFDLDIYMSATHQSNSSTNSYFAIPVVLDTAKF